MSKIWENIEDKKDFISRPYSKKEESLINKWLENNKPKQDFRCIEEFSRNYQPKQSGNTRLDI